MWLQILQQCVVPLGMNRGISGIQVYSILSSLSPFSRTTLSCCLFSALYSASSPSSPFCSAHLLVDAVHCHSSEINGMLVCTYSSQLLSRCTLPGTLGISGATEREGFISLFPITVLHPNPFLLTLHKCPWQHLLTV